MFLGQIGLIALGIGFLLLAAQIIETGCSISRNDKKRYLQISLKSKISRTSHEEKFMKDNFLNYYILKVRNICFMIGLPLVVGTLFFNELTK